MNDVAMLDLVMGPQPADELSTNEDGSVDDNELEPVVYRIDARKGLVQAMSYCEQNPAPAPHLG